MRKQVIGYIGILLALVLALTTINCQSATTAKTAESKQCPLAAMGVPCADEMPGKVCPITQGKDPCNSCVTQARELQAKNEIEELDAQFTKHMDAKEYDKALNVVNQIDKALPVNPKLGYNPQMVDARAYVYMVKGDYDKALESYNQLLKSFPENVGSLYNITCIYSLKGNKPMACEYLGRAVQAGYFDWEHMDQDTDLDNIRSEATYKEIRTSLQAKSPVIKRASACGGECRTCPSQVKEAVHSHSDGASCTNKDKCDKDGKCTGTCTEKEKANCPLHKK